MSCVAPGQEGTYLEANGRTLMLVQVFALQAHALTFHQTLSL